GGLGVLVNVPHSFTVASWTPNDGHPTGIFPTKCGRTDCHIHDGLVDQHLLTAYRAAIAIFLRRRAKRFVQGFRRERRVVLATHTSLSGWVPSHQEIPPTSESS